MCNLPSSQWEPVKPALHVHVVSLANRKQVPPLRQTVTSHDGIAVTQVSHVVKLYISISILYAYILIF